MSSSSTLFLGSDTFSLRTMTMLFNFQLMISLLFQKPIVSFMLSLSHACAHLCARTPTHLQSGCLSYLYPSINLNSIIFAVTTNYSIWLIWFLVDSLLHALQKFVFRHSSWTHIGRGIQNVDICTK